MAFCSKCGTEVEKEAKYCSSCGARLQQGQKVGNGANNYSKTLLWISIVIASVIAIYQLTWAGKSSLWWVLFILSSAIILQGVYIVKRCK